MCHAKFSTFLFGYFKMQFVSQVRKFECNSWSASLGFRPVINLTISWKKIMLVCKFLLSANLTWVKAK
jgi:hypothetical protein